jgi:predicted MFS family arabinose efflux permease
VYYSGALAMFCLGVLGIKAKTLVERKPKISYKHILKDTLFMRFLFFVFIEGTVRTMTTGGYLSYFFDDVMETPLQIGMIYCFWTAFEIPVLANSDKLLKKFGSKKLFIAGFVAIIIQLYLFSLFTAEMPFAFKFAATLIHGLSFSLNYIALMDYLDRYAHKDMKTSYLAAKNISRTTLATVVGGALGGIIIANFGATMLMRGGAVAMVFMAIFFLLFVKSPTEK